VEKTTLGFILPFPQCVTSEGQSDWTSPSAGLKKTAVTIGEINSNALRGNEMRQGVLTHLPQFERFTPMPLTRNVKDQRNAKFAFDRKRQECSSALQKLATCFAMMRAAASVCASLRSLTSEND
jgi:hypothetical protein